MKEQNFQQNVGRASRGAGGIVALSPGGGRVALPFVAPGGSVVGVNGLASDTVHDRRMTGNRNSETTSLRDIRARRDIHGEAASHSPSVGKDPVELPASLYSRAIDLRYWLAALGAGALAWVVLLRLV